MTEYLTDDQIIDMVHGFGRSPFNENKFLIEIMVSSLKEREKIALRLRFYEGMSYINIAYIFDFKYTKVAENLVQRALDSLKTSYLDHKRIMALIKEENNYV